MLIDWFTVCAQAINFLILVWLLRRFLYRPVLAAIDAREKKIAAQIADAAARETKAQADERRRFANAMRRSTTSARVCCARPRTKPPRSVSASSSRPGRTRNCCAQTDPGPGRPSGRNSAANCRMRTQAEVFAVARKTLADLAGASLEDRMIEVFIARLRELPRTAAALTAAGADPARSASQLRCLVRSAFDSPRCGTRAKSRPRYTSASARTSTIRFETSPELVCGVELTVDGVKLAWSVADYLSSLAQSHGSRVTAPALAAAAPPMPCRRKPQHAH